MSAARRAWAYGFIRRARGRLPAYGSPEWQALPEPEKIAACVIAAEAWALTGDRLEADLRAELEASQRAHKAAEDAEYVARRDGHAQRWTGRGFKADPTEGDRIEVEFRAWLAEGG